MTAKRFVVGLIKDNRNRPIGAAIFNVITKSIEINAINNLESRLLAGEEIKGLSTTTKISYYGDANNYTFKDYIKVIHNRYYDTSKLPIIDSAGNVIKQGVDVCIGSIGADTLKKYIVVNTEGEINFLNEREVRKKLPVGLIDYGDRLVLSKECKNIFMSTEEFNNLTRGETP